MLRIDVKKTDLVDLQKPLLAYCDQYYGKDSAQNVRPLIQQLHNCRADLKNVSSTSGHESAIESLEKYLAAISLMEQRFVWGETDNTVKIKTTWYDPLRPREKVVASSLPLERAAAVFNLGAVYSCGAADTDRSSSEGQKMAIQKFQKAAGLFNLVRDQLLPQVVSKSLTVDLTQNGLNMLSSVMIAQAQSCFYESAVKDKLGRGLLSKLAHQVSEHYQAAASSAKKLAGSVDPTWGHTFLCQQKAFLSAAHFQQACAMKEEANKTMTGFGLCIRRFKEALALADEAAKFKLTDVEALKQVIMTEFKPVESDNNEVYMQIVPDRTALPPLGKIATVKATNESLDKVDNRNDFQAHRKVLEQLLPQEVRSYAQDYKSRAESLVLSIDEEGRQYAAGVEEALHEMNLPYCLEPPTDGVSDELWNKVQELQQKGGGGALSHTLEALKEMDVMVHQLASEIRADLDKEENEDNQLRTQFAAQWQRQPSRSLNSTFRQQIQVYVTKIEQARDANVTIEGRIQDMKPVLTLLDKTRHELDAALPQGGAAEGGPAVVAVQAGLRDLEKRRTEASQAAEALKQEILQTPIDADLLEAMRNHKAFQDVVQKKLDAYGQHRIQVTLQRQAITDAIAQVRSAFDVMGNAGKCNSRVTFLSDLDRAANGVLQSLSDASEGINFFSRLGDYLRTIQQQTSDFIFARTEEKNALLQVLNRGSGGSGPSAYAPPAPSNPNFMPTATVIASPVTEMPNNMPVPSAPIMGYVIPNA